jgi:hypothetical protein
VAACCVPFAGGAVGLLWWDNREESTDKTVGSESDAVDNRCFVEHLSVKLHRGSGKFQ